MSRQNNSSSQSIKVLLTADVLKNRKKRHINSRILNHIQGINQNPKIKG